MTRRRRTIAVGLSSLVVLGATVGFAQRAAQEAPAEPTYAAATPGISTLEPGVVAIQLRLGETDRTPQSWSGKVSLDRGEVLAIEGGRFRKGDAVDGREGWKARSLVVRKAAAKAAAKKKAAAANPAVGGPGNAGRTVVPTVVNIALRAPAEAVLKVVAEPATFEIPLRDLADLAPHAYASGRVVARRVPPSMALASTGLQEDFPVAAADGPDRVWVAYVAHAPRGPEISTALAARPKRFADYVPTGGGDQVRLTLIEKGTKGASYDVTPPGRDVWRPAIARDGRGRLVVVWSEFRDGDFDLFARTFDPAAARLGDETRLTTENGSDADVALATAADGRVHVAWQRWRDGRAEIVLGRLDDEGRLADARPVSRTTANDWSPALAADAKGNLWVGFDTYEAGNYDVRLVQARPDGTLSAPIVVAGTSRYETKPSLAVDAGGRVWVAYEERTDNWGKDAENLVTGAGSTLYRAATVRVRCLDGERLLDAGNPVANAPTGEGLDALNSIPRLAVDVAGRVWLAFRHRQEAVWGNNLVMVVGGVWVEYLTALGAGGWGPLLPLPNSDGLLDNRPALVATPGALMVIYNSDGRLRREVEHRPELTPTYYSHSGTPPGVVNNDLFAARVETPATPAGVPAPTLTLVTGNEPAAQPVPAVHPNEAADVARLRSYRVQAAGTTYQLHRGEFHRHTELSQDGGSDGTLEDMWRYAIDVADFDWLGNGDHDNGGGKEYTWWLVQKTTDLYHSPKFSSMFTYERSVSYPHGHRNVMFDRRGVRTLPRLVADGKVVDEDTPMLYDYLKELNGLCASHTSATGMGTDWRDMNPTYEPMVEIFQGHRQSYEHLGAPRGARRPGESIGGWQPLGMIWNALAMQYRIGFQASSDHISTHISYAIALVDQPTRAGVLDAFRRRHCYGATDNIVLDVRTADNRHIMGDEFDAPADGSPVRLRVAIHGTAPVARVDVIKDFVYVYSTEPKSDRVAFEWTDNETRGPGLSWYYVRAIQADGQMAWGSPMWVRSTNRAAGR